MSSCFGSRIRHNKPEEGRKAYRQEISDKINEEEGNSLNIRIDKNYQALS